MITPKESIQFRPGETFRLLRWNQGVDRVQIVLEPNRSVPLHGAGDHWHYHRASELTLVLHGAGTRFVADSIELFDSGDLVLIGTNVPHYLYQIGPSSGISLQWEFPLEHGVWSFEEAAPMRLLLDRARRGLVILGSTAQSVRHQMEELPRLAGMIRLSVFLRIMGELADAPVEDMRPLASSPFSLTGLTAHRDAMRDAVSYILAHYRDEVYLDELLRLTAMSRATFARQFQLHTGKSFGAFVNQVRLSAVCRGLRESPESISTIALGSGFNQLSFFNRLFRREFGMSPMAYRRAQRGNDEVGS